MIGCDDTIEVRPLEEADVLALTALASANHGSRWFDWYSTAAQNRAAVLAAQATHAAGKDVLAGIWLGKTITGVIGLDQVNTWNRTAAINYWLGTEYRGRGLATRACRLVIRYAFTELQLNRLEISIATANRKSRAIAERLGCTLEGIRHQAERVNPAIHAYEDFSEEEIAHTPAGSFFHHAVYRLLRCEWQADA